MEEQAKVFGYLPGKRTPKSVGVQLEPEPKKLAYIPRTMLVRVAPVAGHYDPSDKGFAIIHVIKKWLKLANLEYLEADDHELDLHLAILRDSGTHPLGPKPVIQPVIQSQRREDASW